MDTQNLASAQLALPPNLQTINVNLHLTPGEYLALMTSARANELSLSEQIRDELASEGALFQNPVYSANARSERENISVVTWMNKPELYANLVLGSLSPKAGFQRYAGDVHFITIEPDRGCRNIGEAYELGRQAAIRNHNSRIIIYIHQDAYPVDWMYLEKVYLAHKAGVMATGVIGCIEQTGGAWFHGRDSGRMAGFIDMGTGRIIGYEDRPVKVVDALVFSASADIPWSTDYLGPHMAVEDYCMRIQEAGGQIWNISTQFMHLSPGSTDDSFWESVEIFRRNWAHRLPAELESIEALKDRTYRERAAMGLDMNGQITPEGQAQLDRMKQETQAMMERNKKPASLDDFRRKQRDHEEMRQRIRAELERNKRK